MARPDPLIDTAALARNRKRAEPTALFLQEAARGEIDDRVNMVKKTFQSVAIVTPFPAIWQDRITGAHIVPDDDVLDLKRGQYDLVLHSLGLHWANDPVGQLIQCRHALKPDGLLLALALGGHTLYELRACLAEAESTVTGGLSPRVAPMGEVRDLGALLQRAGFALPVADTVPLDVVYRSAWHLMRDLRAMGETNAMTARLRCPTRRAVLEKAADLYQQTFPATQGGIQARFEIIVLTGWAPHDSQQKPLRPGSALKRLSDALGTDETSLPD